MRYRGVAVDSTKVSVRGAMPVAMCGRDTTARGLMRYFNTPTGASASDFFPANSPGLNRPAGLQSDSSFLSSYCGSNCNPTDADARLSARVISGTALKACEQIVSRLI